jgi:hypothetical protein
MQKSEKFNWFVKGFIESCEGHNGEYIREIGTIDSDQKTREELIPYLKKIFDMVYDAEERGEIDPEKYIREMRDWW